MNKQTRSPVLVYDGDCGICLEWVHYWQRLTGDQVDYRPFQQAHADYPSIPQANFEKAIQFIETDGTVRSGADATFAIYKYVPACSFLSQLYRYVPGFAFFSEAAYNFFSRHRGLLAFLTHLLWGRNRQPAQYQLTSQLFLRLLGCIYLAAFVSFGIQVLGLIGSRGIVPLELYLPRLEQHLGTGAILQAPMVFWFYLSDNMLQFTCFLGALLSLMVIFKVFQRVALALLYLLYLSLFYAGQTFMTFQWDLLLLEAGFLAIFLESGARFVVWLYRWLVFRFMFLGGLVKILSHDPNWDALTALNFHFETQPLPTVFAWYAHHLPETFLKTGVALTLITELILPFLIFAPRRFRMVAALCFILFQSLIIVTGNYNFFNLLTIALCLFLFDDAALATILPSGLAARLKGRQALSRSGYLSYAFVPLGIVILFSSLEQIHALTNTRSNQPLSFLSRVIGPWHIVQNYGPFAVMTTVRREIIIEGSMDGRDWQEYHFRFKPGDVSARPRWATPHQPRLDWQMWFAALGGSDRHPWFRSLLYGLLSNSEPVLRLLANNPFPDTGPRLLRARFYRYQFTSPSQRKSNGDWWTRELVGEYHGPVRLSPGTDN